MYIICFFGISAEKKKVLRKNVKKIMPRNSPNLVQDINLPTEKAYFSNRVSTKDSVTRPL